MCSFKKQIVYQLDFIRFPKGRWLVKKIIKTEKQSGYLLIPTSEHD